MFHKVDRESGPLAALVLCLAAAGALFTWHTTGQDYTNLTARIANQCPAVGDALPFVMTHLKSVDSYLSNGKLSCAQVETLAKVSLGSGSGPNSAAVERELAKITAVR